MSLQQLVAAFKSPQGALSVVTTIVTILGTVGLLNAGLTTALTSLCTAILGVIMAVTHATVTTKIIAGAVAASKPPAANDPIVKPTED